MPSMREQHGGKAEHPRLYVIWKGMRSRCLSKTNKRYSDYGGRGISICDEWGLFSKFRDWALDNGYADNLSLDREDNDGPYSPVNCRWATALVQARNSRHVHWVEAFGERHPISVWAKDDRCVVSYDSLKRRLRAGWKPELAISSARVSGKGVARKLGQKHWEELPSKCKRGHEYTEASTYIYGNKRQCILCQKIVRTGDS